MSKHALVFLVIAISTKLALSQYQECKSNEDCRTAFSFCAIDAKNPNSAYKLCYDKKKKGNQSNMIICNLF